MTRFRISRMVRIANTVLALLALAGASSGCGTDKSPAVANPTDAQARAYLSRVVAVATTGDLAALCKLGPGTCAKLAVTTHAADKLPSGAPTVVGSSDVPSSSDSSGATLQGGRLLEVCGLDGQGHGYRTRLLFFGSDVDHFTVIEPLYWTGVGWEATSNAAASTSDNGSEWENCPSGT